MPQVIPITTRKSSRNYATVNISVTRQDIKNGMAHPWLAPCSLALTRELAIDGAEVKHDQIRLFREGKKDVVLTTPEIVQNFSYIFDMHGKGNPFNFAVTVPAGLVSAKQEVA